MKTNEMSGGEKARIRKPRKKRWSKDDTELFLLSLPTLLWFLIFSYLPMFGVIIAFKVYRLSPGGQRMGRIWEFQLLLHIQLIYHAPSQHDSLQHCVHHYQRQCCGGRRTDVEQHAQQEGFQSVPDDDVSALFHVVGGYQLFRLCASHAGERLH